MGQNQVATTEDYTRFADQLRVLACLARLGDIHDELGPLADELDATGDRGLKAVAHALRHEESALDELGASLLRETTKAGAKRSEHFEYYRTLAVLGALGNVVDRLAGTH